MNDINMFENNQSSNSVLFLIFICVIIVYSNSLNGEWIFDDWHNIVQRAELHLETFSFKNIINTFFIENNDKIKLYRPISCLSFGLNWFIGEANTRGYHLINLLIHLIAISLVFSIAKKFLRLVDYKGDILLVAGLGALLWAVHPIQTQAVSYIVQRMASLAAMFYLAGIYFYLIFKEKRQTKWLIGSLTMFSFSVLSKENAVLFPATIILIEVLLSNNIIARKKYKILTVSAVFIIAFIFVVLMVLNSIYIQSLIKEAYSLRPFSLIERLLTQSRVLMYYIYLVFMSPPEAFGFNNAFTLSKSLLDPITTLFSIVFILFSIVFSIYLIMVDNRLWRLIGFSFLFFYAHHIVESTIIPLELYFEHRNYLPSAFIFIPVALLVDYFITRSTRKQNFIFNCLIIFAISIVIIGIGLTAYERNSIWQSRIKFWSEAIKNDPNGFRAYHNLALEYDPVNSSYYKKSDLPLAISIYETALRKEDRETQINKSLSLFNLSMIFAKLNDPDRAILYFNTLERYLRLNNAKPGVEIYKNLSLLLLKTDRLDEALFYIKKGYIKYPNELEIIRIKGLLLAIAGKNAKSLEIFRKGIHIANVGKDNNVIFRDYGVVLTFSGYYDRGLWFLLKYHEKNISDLATLYFIANNLMSQGKYNESSFFIDRFYSQLSLYQLKSIIKKIDEPVDLYYLSVDKSSMKQVLVDRFQIIAIESTQNDLNEIENDF